MPNELFELNDSEVKTQVIHSKIAIFDDPEDEEPARYEDNWHARIASVGNGEAIWWTELYTEKDTALRALDLLPGCNVVGTETGTPEFYYCAQDDFGSMYMKPSEIEFLDADE